MNIEIWLIGASVFVLIWEKLPNWGQWFHRLISVLPTPLQRLYYQLHCPYCAGFWLALGLSLLTGIWTLPSLQGSMQWLSLAAEPVARFLDALASALIIHAVVLGQRGLSWVATQSHLLNMRIDSENKSTDS